MRKVNWKQETNKWKQKNPKVKIKQKFQLMLDYLLIIQNTTAGCLCLNTISSAGFPNNKIITQPNAVPRGQLFATLLNSNFKNKLSFKHPTRTLVSMLGPDTGPLYWVKLIDLEIK